MSPLLEKLIQERNTLEAHITELNAQRKELIAAIEAIQAVQARSDKPITPLVPVKFQTSSVAAMTVDAICDRIINHAFISYTESCSVHELLERVRSMNKHASIGTDQFKKALERLCRKNLLVMHPVAVNGLGTVPYYRRPTP